MGPEGYKENDESDEAVAEDAEMDLDEQDFAQAEKKFDHEIQALEAKRPPTPRSNPVILELLEELDALAYALEEKVKEGPIDEEPPATTGPLRHSAIDYCTSDLHDPLETSADNQKQSASLIRL